MSPLLSCPALVLLLAGRFGAQDETATPVLLPHLEQIVPGVYAAGFADRYRSANCGWVALEKEALLIDLPRGVPAAAYLAEVTRRSGKPSRRLVLTGLRPDDVPLVEALLAAGVTQVILPAEAGTRLLAAGKKIPPAQVRRLDAKAALGDAADSVDFLPLDDTILGAGCAAVHLPARGVLFAGPLAVHGPRCELAGSDTAAWVGALRRLEALGAKHVVPGRGSWGGAEILARQRHFLHELRRQVAWVIAQGRAKETLAEQVRVPDSFLDWMPYDRPLPEDVEHVYRELTVPAAPFHGRPPAPDDRRPHALVLIGDQPHEPGHIEEGLRPVFEATGVVPHFAVDVRALSAANLARVRLFVILRDGLLRPTLDAKADTVWMTPEQERAVVAFVERGGGFLNLHNSLGIYPEGGPYLRLAGGKFTTHGPLERFRVEVVADHPVTRGVRAFTVADEQHTPEPDLAKVRLLLRSRADDGKTAAAGWAYEPGQGRLCHLAPGHTRESLLHPMYQRLLRNAVRWCARLEDKGAE